MAMAGQRKPASQYVHRLTAAGLDDRREWT